MLRIRHYGICARPALLHAPGVDPEFADLLCGETILIRSREGGRTVWSDDDHLSKVKLLFLAKLKAEFEEPFVRDAPLSTEFFDLWWTAQPFDDFADQQDILDNFDPRWAAQAPSTGRWTVDEMLRRLADHQPRSDFPIEQPKYRVWWQGDVIGWLEDPMWDPPVLHGKWSPTVNPKGREFARDGSEGKAYPVVVEGATYFRGDMVRRSESVTVSVTLVSPTRD